MHELNVVVEKHTDGYIAYPLGVKGVVIGEGDTCDVALSDMKSALDFDIETFGPDVLEAEQPILEAFIAEAMVAA